MWALSQIRPLSGDIIANSFEVLPLGNLPLIDTGEGNQLVSIAAVASWLGTYVSVVDPLSNLAQVDFAPGSTGFSGGLLPNACDIDNNASNDMFTIDDVERLHDATMLFNATLIYKDGTTASISALDHATRNELLTLFPELANLHDRNAYQAARLALKSHEARLLVGKLAA